MKKIIDSYSLSTLEREIKIHLGDSVSFTNGCYLQLKPENGMIFGDSPYGTMWGCRYNDDYINTIVNWLKYWNDDRCENGQLLQVF